MIVREATLDDTRGILDVYLTNPDRPFNKPVEGMGIAERQSYGGPWMSVESCAIHLNNMLAWGYVPLVVVHEGRVIAETEYYVGRDIPPLGKTLDISVLYVHLEYQRRGAGTLLMEEMISRARVAGCEHITVSGCSPSQGFYDRFGFKRLVILSTVNCRPVREAHAPDWSRYVPNDFEPTPTSTLWIGRFLSPTQKWREIHDSLKKREALLSQHSGCPDPIGVRLESEGAGESLAFLLPEWGEAKKADAYCWSETVTDRPLSQLISVAADLGYQQLCLLCHPKVADDVARVCGSEPKGSWVIEGRRL